VPRLPSEREQEGIFSKLKTGAPSCTPSATLIEFQVVIAEEVLRVEEELLANMSSKELFLESSKKLIQDKIIGYKFGMNDKKINMTEAKKSINDVQEGLKNIDLQIAKLQINVRKL
jgi:hypothetical protein